MKFWWVENEWSKAFFDNLHLFGNEAGYGWADKICHFLLHLLIVVVSSICFRQPIILGIIISLVWGFGWEWLKDCLICRKGASKFDIIFNLLGMTIGIIIVWSGGYPWIY